METFYLLPMSVSPAGGYFVETFFFLPVPDRSAPSPSGGATGPKTANYEGSSWENSLLSKGIWG